MLCGETVAVCRENRTEHTDTLCGMITRVVRIETTKRQSARWAGKWIYEARDHIPQFSSAEP
jgi:hypothetical protein